MANLNKVFMIGRLTRDPELRYLPNGTPKAELRLATSREYKGRDGQQQKDVCYIDVVVWSRQAEIAKQYLAKGRQVFIEGRLDFQEWEGKDGSKRSKHEIVADRVQFLDRGNEGDAQGGGGGSYGRRSNSGYGGGNENYGGGNEGGGGNGGYRGNYGKTYGGNADTDAPMQEAMGVQDSDLPF